MLVKAATSYTSYRELWDEALQLSQVTQGQKGGDNQGRKGTNRDVSEGRKGDECRRVGRGSVASFGQRRCG